MSQARSREQDELHATCFMLGSFFEPEYGGDMILQNVG
jgi:hypothetical protein